MEVQPVLSTADGMIVPSSVVAALPRSTSFGPASTLLRGSFIVVANSSTYRGSGYVSLRLTGASSVEYYPLSRFATLLAATDPPSPPDLVSSKFSDDGAAIFMLFDSDTDQIASGFCSSTFAFTGSERARCSWLNASTAMGRFNPAFENAAPGDVLSLLADRVKAKCEGSCDAYMYSAGSSVTIATATSPVRPRVVVSVPSSISYCENVTVDASLSSGHGGRTWANVSWSISAPGVDTTELLALFASNGRSLYQVVSFPAAVLPAGPSYIFSMTATNFLGVESSGGAIITVSSNPNLPSLQILGSALFTVTPADTLTIYSGVAISACAEGALTFTTTWRVAIGDEVEDVQYEPLSKTPSVLIVGPRTLQPGRRYSVLVTTEVGATALNPSVSATAHAFVDVEDGGVVTVVGGGDERLVFPTGTARIDASKSYDENFERAGSILEYSWTCSMQSVLNFGQTCSSVIESGSGSSVLLVSGPLLLEREIYAFSVVAAAPDGRFGSRTVRLLVQDAASSTVVAIGTPPLKVNADSRLTLTAELEASYALTGTWAAYLGSTRLHIATLTPQEKTFSASDVRAGIDFAIVVPRNVLSAGTEVRFRLLADRAYSNAGTKYQSYSEVSIVINAPPSSGSLRTLPSAGNALQTSFKLSAVGWTDVSEDLPLAYLFSYTQNPESPALVTQARSGKNTASADLPQGLEYLAYAVELEVVIYDALLASASDTAVVRVLPAALNVSDYLAAQLAKFQTTGTVSDATLLINNVATALGVKNCTANQTYCESRSRKPCSQRADSCGSCSAGFVGIVGASNAKCVPLSSLSGSYTLVGSSCTDDDGCVLGSCFRGVCEAPAQTCPSTTEDVCSGYGSCAFADNNGAQRFNCTVLDTNCFATCVCSGGRGGYGCSLTAAELLSLDGTRKTLCDLFVRVASLSNPSADIMDSFVGTMYATYEPAEVVTSASFNACSNAMQIVTRLAAAGLLRGARDDTSSRLVQVASRFITNGANSSSSSNEQLADIAKGLLLTMADGQVDTEVATDALKLTASKGQASTLGRISPPLSESQQAYGQGPSVSMELAEGAALACDSGAGYVDLSLAEWGKNPFPGASALSTPQLKFESRTPTDSRRSRRLSSTDLGGDVQYYIIFKYNSAQNFSANNPYGNSTFPQCTTYDATSQRYVGCQDCALATYTDLNVTFACFSVGNLCGSSSRRRLADDDGAVDDGGFGEQTSVTSIQYSALLDTFTGVLGTNPFAASWQGAKGVFSFVLSLLTTFILGLVYFRRWDISDHNCVMYSGTEVQSEKGGARGGLNSGFGSFGGLDGAGSFDSSDWAATSFFQPGSQADSELFGGDGGGGGGGGGGGSTSSWSFDTSEEGCEEGCDMEVIDSYLEALIPIEGLNGTVDVWMQLRAMLEAHPLTGVFGGPSLRETRVLRWTTLCLVFLMTLFIDTLFFSTFYPSAGECETYTDEVACITPQNSAVSSPLCTWGADRSLENGGSCAASPPPSDFVFSMIIVLMIIVIAVPLSFLYEYVLLSVCALRPAFEVWGMYGVLGSSTQSVGLYDTSKLQPPITNLRDKSRVHAHTNSRTIKPVTGGHDLLAADTLAVYHELLSVDGELEEILSTLERLSAQTERVNEDVTVAIRSILGVNSDGTPVPLSTLQWIRYGSARRRLRAKLELARRQEREICAVLGQLGSGETLGKDVALIQYFVLEQFSAFKRYALRAHFFAFDATSSLPIHPAKWAAGWAFVLLSALFFVYWALAWGIATQTAQVNLWAQNFALALFQDMAIVAVFRQYIVYMVATLTVKPQLQAVYRLLQRRAIEYVQDALPPRAALVQRFSPACRVSRLKIAEHLAAATILRTISDADAHEARQAHNSHIPWAALWVVGIPVVVGVFSKAGGELVLDTVLPTLLSMLIVAHYLLYTYSAALLVLPYLGLLLFLYLRWAWYRRAQERVAQAIARGGRMESVTQWRRRRQSAKHDPFLRHVCMGCYNNLVDVAAYCVVLCSHPENIPENILKILCGLRGEARKDSTVWRQMNYPQELQGVVSASRAKKDKAKRVPAAVLPRSIQELARDRGCEAPRRSCYVVGLQVVGVVTAGPGECKDDTPLGAIVLKAEHPERHRSDAAKLYAYRFGHTSSYSLALVRIVSRYRDQVAAAAIVCITLQDEEAIMSVEEDDDLLEYAGGIHVRDLALMLEALLHVYSPGGPLRQHQLRHFLQSYDDWVPPHCVPTTRAEMDPLLSLRRERGPKAYFDQGHLELEEYSRFARKYEWLHPRHSKTQESGRWSFVRTLLDREERHRLEVSSRLMRTEHEVRKIAEAKVHFDEFVAWFVDCARQCPTP
ncbi:REJ domain-containing protein [Ochromonadaceae sp. CCMP2298]|nr:REJ domain-containing protein [Ochromonadaceae sp. CCMP2298]